MYAYSYSQINQISCKYAAWVQQLHKSTVQIVHECDMHHMKFDKSRQRTVQRALIILWYGCVYEWFWLVFYQYGLSQSTIGIINYIHCYLCGVITHPRPNLFNSIPIKVWIRNYAPYFYVDVVIYPWPNLNETLSIKWVCCELFVPDEIAELDMSQNNMVDTPNFYLPHLCKLNLRQNQLTTFPNFIHGPELRKLFLRGNLINEIAQHHLSPLVELEVRTSDYVS